MSTSSRVDLTGKTIGNWRLLRPLGQGAFGAVYEAEHQAIAGRRAALKVLDSEMSVHVDLKRRFVNEASAASRAAHENIVQVFDGGVTDEGVCYLVMELLGGQSLSQVIRARRMNVARAVNLGVQVASALQLAHSIGIVHRDLKPDNIFIVPRDHNQEFVKVLDFGVAKLRDDEMTTKTGIWLGTPSYMSPEQWQTLSDIDGRADIYSLGVILYESMTGQLPFTGVSPYEWLNAHLTSPVPDPGMLAPMPPQMSQLIQRMMAKRREDRPQSAPEVISELRRCTLMRGGPWGGPPGSGPSPAVVSPSEPRPSTLRLGTGEVREEVRGSAPVPRVVRLPQFVSGSLVGGVVGGVLVGGLVWALRPAEPQQLQQASQPEPPRAELSAPAPAVPRKAEPPRPRPRQPAALPQELVVMGPARFEMGWGRRRGKPEAPVHWVDVGRFAIAKYEVSMKDYRAYAQEARLSGPQPWDGIANFAVVRDLPVNMVSRDQAAAYCKWRYGSLAGRLPSEAEWEFAARDGRPDRRYTWPGRVLGLIDQGRVNAGAGQPVLLAVHTMQQGATEKGLLHMLGNVAEWVAEDAAAYPGSSARVPPWGIVRGGAANTSLKDLSATGRAFVPPAGRLPYVGFRCAADAPAVEPR